MYRMLLLPLALLQLAAAASIKRQSSSSLAGCLNSASLNPVTPSDSSFSTLDAAFNQRLQPIPAALVQPSSGQGIAAAVKCASENNVSLAALGGGHSYASYGLGGYNNSLIVSLASLKNIDYRSDGTVRIEGGARLGDVALALNNVGKAVPHGVCPYVGVGGHFAFGGYGYTSRMWGLSLDNVYAYDVVLANGSYVTNLTRNVDSDLFWALNGAAPSYGIVTAYYLQTHDAPQTNIHFFYGWDNGVDPQTATNIFSQFQSFGAQAPPEFTITFTAYNGLAVQLTGMYYGSQESYNSTIAPLLASLPSGYTSNVGVLSWIDGVQALAGKQGLNTANAQESRDTFYAKSIMTPESAPLSNSTLLSYFQYLKNTQTSTNWFAETNVYGGSGSAINNKSLSDSSFAHRDRLLTFQMYASSSSYSPPFPSEGINFVQGMYDIIQNSISSDQQASYSNYIDPQLSQQQTQSLYWGSQYSRLASLKARYDPTNLFKNPQSIQPSQDNSVTTTTSAATTNGGNGPTSTITGTPAQPTTARQGNGAGISSAPCTAMLAAAAVLIFFL